MIKAVIGHVDGTAIRYPAIPERVGGRFKSTFKSDTICWISPCSARYFAITDPARMGMPRLLKMLAHPIATC
jgi:hypothetical protein